MQESLHQRLDRFGRSAAPVIIAAILILFTAARDPDLGVPIAAPNLALICIYFWTVQRPEAMSAAGAFGLGLMQDLLTDFALGANAATLLLAHVLAIAQRRFLLSQSFLVAWMAFGLFAIGAEGMRAGLSIVFADRPPVLAEAGLRVAATIALHPLFAWMLGKIDARLYRDES